MLSTRYLNNSTAETNFRLKWIQIEVSSLCQASCIYCPHTAYRKLWLGRLFPEALFSKLTSVFTHSDLVFLQGWGEPLLHPQFFDFIRIAKQHGSMVGTTTNGMLVNRDIAKQLVDSGLDIISFSLAGSSLKNDLVRCGTSINHVLKAIEWVREERERRMSPTPRIHIAYLFLRSLASELEKLPSIAADAGAEKIVISTLSLIPDPSLTGEAFFTSETMWEEESKELQDLVKEHILKEASNWAGKIEVDLETKKFHYKKTKPIQCPERPWDSLFIGSDGKVSPCVFLCLPVRRAPVDMFQMNFGSLANVSDAENILHRPSYQVFRESFEQGSLPFPCSRCARRGTTYQGVS
ncbi:MAG: radical SAM/SPASM domain-containing protein [Thermodesulforhabdaceae bacterium]